jgi:hypothetical protein
MRFSSTDANKQWLILTGGAGFYYLQATVDRWANISAVSPGPIDGDPVAICPLHWDDDEFIFGHGATTAYAVSAMTDIGTTTPTALAGTNYNTSPYTNAIPATHGGICWDGVQAIPSAATGGPTVPPDGGTITPPGGSPVTLVGTGATVQAVTFPGYTGSRRGVPMPGDRAAWDETLYGSLHARDIADETYIHHKDPDDPAPRKLIELDDVDITDITDIADDDALLWDEATETFLPADVLTPTEHTAIGNDSPHHAAVTLGAGNDAALALSGQELTLTIPPPSGTYRQYTYVPDGLGAFSFVVDDDGQPVFGQFELE